MAYVSVAQRTGGANKANSGVDSFLISLGQKESSGNYHALGPVITNPNSNYYKDRAYGKYQVMGKNVPSWTKQYLGVSMTPEQFLKDQSAQDRLMRARASELFNTYGNWDDVASVHFSGRPLKLSGNAADQLGTTTSRYVREVVGGLSDQPTRSAYVPVAQRTTAPEPARKNDALFTLTPGITTPDRMNPDVMLNPGFLTPTKLLSTIGQGMARGSAATGQKIVSGLGERFFGLEPNELVDPDNFFGDNPTSSKIGRLVFGKDAPFNATSEDVEFLEAFGIDKEAAAGTGGSLTLLLTALDLTGAGGASKGLAGLMRTLKLADNTADVARALKAVGFADDIIEQYAPLFAKAKSTKAVQLTLEAATKLQEGTRTASYLPVVKRATPEDLVQIYRSAGGRASFQPETFSKADEVIDQIFTEMELARPGERRPLFDDGYVVGYEGVQSTFPQWVPSHLRSRELFDKTFPDLDNLQYPKGSRKIELYDVILDELDRRLGVDTKLIRGNIKANGIKQGKVSEVGNSSLGRNGGGASIGEGGKIKRPPSAQQIVGAKPDPRITKTETTLLKDKIKNQATGAKAGMKAGLEEGMGRGEVQGFFEGSKEGVKKGKQIGKAEAENLGANKLSSAVRKEELKGLKGAIKIRAQKDAIIDVLKNSGESAERIKKMVVDHVKEALDPADRGKALVLVRDAKTQKDLVKAFSRINRWAEDSIKNGVKNEVLNIQKKVMDSPSISIDYKARVKELMGDFELKGHKESTLERLKATQEFLENEAAKGNDVDMPRRILKALDILNRTPFDEITLNQLTGLKAEMELLEDLGRTKFRTTEAVWEAQKGKILDSVKAQGVEPLTNHPLIKPEIGERLTMTEKLKNLVWSAGNQAARVDKAISPMDTIFDLLDGGKATYDGANFRFFKGQVDAGYGRYISRKEALQEPVIELATKHGLEDTNFERIGVVAAREQDGGLEKLIASGFTKEQVEAVQLTLQEQEVLNLMRQTFDSQFPEIKETMRKVYNQPVEKVKNYFSFMTDWKSMDESEVFERFGSQAPDQYGAPRKNVEAGFVKSRVGGDQKIKINALDVFLQHIDNTSYLLELGETSKMLGEVAASPRYGELVGDVGQLMVREWLDVVARKGGAAGAQEIAILNTLRKNVGIGILGLKLSTIAIQPTSLIDGMGFIGVKYGTKGATNFLTDSGWRKFVGKMPEISDRLGGEFALRELTDDSWIQNIQRKGFIPLQKLDQMTAGMVAAGAYERKMIELGEAVDFAKYNPEALAYAQLAVRRTQSSGSFKDVPLAVSRGALTGNRSLDRAILQFQNFLLTRWSRIRHDAWRAGVRTKDPKKAIPIFTALIMASLAGAGIRLGVNKLQDFLTGREDEDEASEDLTKGFMYEMTGNVPFLGTAVSMAMYDGEMFPILDAPKGVVSGLNRVITSKSEGAKLRGLTEFAGSTGALLGIPGSAQAEQLAGGFLQDEKKPEKGGLPKLPKLPKLPSLPKLPTF